MAPLLSVLMPTYNGEKYLRDALESVRAQITDELEIIFVDDGSTDQTLNIVSDYAKHFPIKVVSPGRLGTWVAASNVGLREARGEWACLLHHDDFWLPGRIERMRHEMESAKGALILHNAMYVGPEGQKLGRWTCPLKEGTVAPKQFLQRLLIQNFIAMPSPVFRRDAALQSGGMDEALWYTADWDLWLRMGALGPVSFIDQILAAFRIHAESQTWARPLKKDEWKQQLEVVLERYLFHGPFAGQFSPFEVKVARASVAVNTALAAVSRKGQVSVSSVIFPLLTLGPWGWYRYVRDSRIVQRVGARLKLLHATRSG